MTSLTNAKVINSEFMTEHGFAFITFTVEDKEYTLQACVNDVGEINTSNDGMLEACNYDANEHSFNDFGVDESISFFRENTDAILV